MFQFTLRGKAHSSTFQALSWFLSPENHSFVLVQILFWSTIASPNNYKSCWMEIKAVFHADLEGWLYS